VAHRLPRYIQFRTVVCDVAKNERSWVMVDPGHVFRRAFSWLPSQFASQSDAPVGPRQFGSTEHLSTEAVAAFVDG